MKWSLWGYKCTARVHTHTHTYSTSVGISLILSCLDRFTNARTRQREGGSVGILLLVKFTPLSSLRSHTTSCQCLLYIWKQTIKLWWLLWKKSGQAANRRWAYMVHVIPASEAGCPSTALTNWLMLSCCLEDKGQGGLVVVTASAALQHYTYFKIC